MNVSNINAGEGYYFIEGPKKGEILKISEELFDQQQLKSDTFSNCLLAFIKTLSEEDLLDIDNLSLENCRDLSDDDLQLIVKKFPNLSILNLTYCEKITDKGVSYLKDLEDLEYLDLSYCKNITDKGFSYLDDLKSSNNLQQITLI